MVIRVLSRLCSRRWGTLEANYREISGFGGKEEEKRAVLKLSIGLSEGLEAK